MPLPVLDESTEELPVDKKKRRKKGSKRRESVEPSEAEVIEEGPSLQAIVDEIFEETVPDESGKPVVKKTKKKVLRKVDGDKEQEIEIISVEKEGEEPETVVTVSEIERPDEGADEEAPVEKRKKKKKSVKKLKPSEEDDYINSLINLDIPRAVLEKYQKVDLDARPGRIVDLVPMIAVQKHQRSTKVEICDVKDLPQVSKKLTFKKVARKEVKPEQSTLPQFRLKSRLTEVVYPPELGIPKVTDLKTVRGRGELSRNVEEALKLLKRKKIKKFKPLEVEQESLEEVDKDQYEKDKPSDEDESAKETYKRPEKTKKEPEDISSVTLKIGKGKKKPQEEDVPESVKLKSIPSKSKPGEEEEAEKPKKIKPTDRPEPLEGEDAEFTVGPVPKFEPRPFGSQEDIDIESEPRSEEDVPQEKDKKKYKRKPKTKPEPETIQHPIVKGVPKPGEEQPENDLNLKYKQKPLPDVNTEGITLRPFEKPLDETAPEDDDGKIEFKPTPKKKIKVPKSKVSPIQVDDETVPDTDVINISELPEYTENTETTQTTHTPHFEQITLIEDIGKNYQFSRITIRTIALYFDKKTKNNSI